MRIVMVLAPHPDDELLGCGGAVLRHIADGDLVHWVVVTAMSEPSFSPIEIAARADLLDVVTRKVGFAERHDLGFGTAALDVYPMSEVVAAVAEVVGRIRPEIVYLPSASDIHSDHRVVHAAGVACTKWFRFPSVVEVLAYEVLSETDMSTTHHVFRPQSYVDVTEFLEAKLELLRLYEGELGAFPFPRSEEAVRALASVRGAAGGYVAAEAFEVIRQRR